MASIQRIGFTRYQNDVSKIFKALGHPARIAIIDKLISHERIMCKELAIDLKLTLPTISRHLQVLMETGIIGYEKSSNVSYYVVNPILVQKAKEALGDVCNKAENHPVNYRNVIFSEQPFQDSF